MISVLICDAEVEAEGFIREQVAGKYYDVIKKIKRFKDKASILFYLEDHKQENAIIFMDTNFQNGKGVETAKEIKSIKETYPIIFMTSDSVYDYSIYEVEHVFLLMKPLNHILLRKAYIKAFEKINDSRSKCIFAVTKTDVKVIPVRDILYIEKEKRKIHITDFRGEISSFYSSFESIERQLDDNFFRCHNSYIINLKKIVSVCNKCVTMVGEREIPVSRAHIKELKELVVAFSMIG